jgi:hypothetical protein
MALREEGFGEVRADEASDAGDEIGSQEFSLSREMEEVCARMTARD